MTPGQTSENGAVYYGVRCPFCQSHRTKRADSHEYGCTVCGATFLLGSALSRVVQVSTKCVHGGPK